MARYGDKAKTKVRKAMRERKHGTLRSGSGKKVTSRKQAIAIGLSEARRAGGKVPAKSSRTRKRATSATSRKRSSATKASGGRKRTSGASGRRRTHTRKKASSTRR